MTLKDHTSFPIQMIKPPIVDKIITLLTNCHLSEREAVIFNESMRILAHQLVKENINLTVFHSFNIIFTLNGEISLYEKSPTNRGHQFSLAMYRMEPIRELKSEYAMMFIFLEEMVHYFWQSADEEFVKNKVVEIVQ